MTEIIAVHGREILDSRGNPTVEVELATVSGFVGRASVPSGASTGQNEAVELRDGGGERYGGKGVVNAVSNVDGELAQVVVGMDVTDQRSLDLAMIEADGTGNKGRLGANAILGISRAAAKAAAEAGALPLFRYLGGPGAYTLPVPCANIMNGGAHAANNIDFQEFMVVPLGFEDFAAALRAVAEIYAGLKKNLVSRGHSGGIGDEGGFAPDLEDNSAALALIAEAVEASGYALGEQIGFALDPAASEFYEGGSYNLEGEGKTLSREEMVEYYVRLCDRYPIVSIEDRPGEDRPRRQVQPAPQDRGGARGLGLLPWPGCVQPESREGGLKVRRTKIIATLGPATSTEESIGALIRVGVDVTRFNFSHGDHAMHLRNARIVRSAAKELDRNVAIMQDLQGPKIRTGEVAGDTELVAGNRVVIAAGDFVGDASRLSTTYDRLAEDVRPGDRLL